MADLENFADIINKAYSKTKAVTGRLSSVQTLGTLDGPGVRYVAFLQGCMLHCGYCHNIETRNACGGYVISADELVKDILSYREYFGADGGVTLSGGEPLLQPQFVMAVFKKLKENGVNTCLDTSGALPENAWDLLGFCDYCLLDIKFRDEFSYQKYIGCSLYKPLEFLDMLQRRNVKTRLRQVVVEGLNDDVRNAEFLAKLKKSYSVVEEIEFLPMRKLCVSKYQSLGLNFPFDSFCETNPETISKMQNFLLNCNK